MLIDSTGNSIYFNSYGGNLQTQVTYKDVYNAFDNYTDPKKPFLKGRFNYYNNVKKQKK